MARGLYAEIDTAALQHNLAIVRKKAPGTKVIAMIKANGYGHGLLHVARALSQADAFGVACLEEALELRYQHIHNRLILMEGFLDNGELKEICHWHLEPVIHTLAQVKTLKQYLRTPLNIWIKIDTGMHRLGFQEAELAHALELLRAHPCIRIVGIMTHFSCAHTPCSVKTETQIKTFQQILTKHHLTDLPHSLCNSGGVMCYPHAHGHFVRPGLMLYGVSPFETCTGQSQGLQPVMTLKTQIIACHHLKVGDQVGYGSAYRCPEDMPIGIIALGYGDGFPWRIPENTKVLINQHHVPIIGRVSMDMISVDLRLVPQTQIHDTVVIWGPENPVENLAAHIGTIPWELLTSLSSRVPVKLKKSTQQAVLC